MLHSVFWQELFCVIRGRLHEVHSVKAPITHIDCLGINVPIARTSVTQKNCFRILCVIIWGPIALSKQYSTHFLIPSDQKTLPTRNQKLTCLFHESCKLDSCWVRAASGPFSENNFCPHQNELDMGFCQCPEVGPKWIETGFWGPKVSGNGSKPTFYPLFIHFRI